MQLYYGLDEPEAFGDVESLLGHFGIRHENGCIEEHDIFVDSWFAALILGLVAAERGRWGPVEIFEEPEPLVFEPEEGESLRISYGNDSVTVPSTAELRKALRKAAWDFLEDANGRIDVEQDDPFDIIERFLQIPGVMKPPL